MAEEHSLSITNVMYFVLDETKREREFYRARGLACPKDILPNAGEIEEDKANADAHAESDYHRTDEQVWVHINLLVESWVTVQINLWYL